MALLGELSPGSVVKIQENGELVDFMVIYQGDMESENGNVFLRRKDVTDEGIRGKSNLFVDSEADNWVMEISLAGIDPILDKYIAQKMIQEDRKKPKKKEATNEQPANF